METQIDQSKNIQNLITTYTRRLQKLEEQRASGDKEPKTLLEIEDIEKELAKLQTDLTAIKKSGKKIGKQVKPRCPYPGMVPFSAENTTFFYGREQEIRNIRLYLREQRYLWIIGPSGSGKSSLVSAGVLPKLKESLWFEKTLIREVRLSDQPQTALSRALEGDVNQPAQTVSDILSKHAPAERLLLAIDQFEELFTLNDRATQNDFVKILQVLRHVEPCTLLIVMRADFYPNLMNSNLWPVDHDERIEIAPLRGDLLREAIEQPAGDVGVELEAGLVQRLLADAADEPGVLPLVQETLFLLWEEMQDNVLSLSTYERLGGEGRSGLAMAIAYKADIAFKSLANNEQKAIARRIFLRLIQFGQGRADTRRQQSETELKAGTDASLFDQTLRHLVNHRLLTLSGGEGIAGKQVDIAHESLINGWPMLQAWLLEWREAEQTRRRLEDRVGEWVRLKREDALLRPIQLLEAEGWLENPDASELGYSKDFIALVQASRTAIEKDEQEKEAARKMLETRIIQIETVQEITNTIQTYAELTELLDSILGVSLPRLNAQAGTIQLLEPDSNHLVMQAVVGSIEHKQYERISVDEGIVGHVVETGTTVYIPDIRQDEQLSYLRQMNSELAIPLKSDNKVIGVFYIGNLQPNAFDEFTLELAQLIADQTAIIIQNALRYAKAKEELIATQQVSTLGTATAALQHRINNTLNIIVPNIRRLRRRVDLEDDIIRDILDIIERNARYASDFINRIQEPLKDTTLLAVDLNSSLEDAQMQVWQQLRDRIGVEAIEVKFYLDKQLPLIQASLGQITEVFRNLIENSCKVMESQGGGTLTVTSRHVSGWIEVEIQDTGPGISSEVKKNLFIRPVPAKQPGRGGRGTGLGLWLSRLLLQKYAGEIIIKDTGENGTTMLVRLPVQRL